MALYHLIDTPVRTGSDGGIFLKENIVSIEEYVPM